MVLTQSNAINQTNVTDEMLDAFFAQAIECHQAEDWQAAENFYHKVLAAIPDQPNVNYNLGMLKVQLKQTKASLAYFKKALAADTDEPKYWFAYVEALAHAGENKQAVDVLMEGIACGLHGEEVDALVRQLEQLANPVVNMTQTSPVIVVNSTEQLSPIVLPHISTRENKQAGSEKNPQQQPTNSGKVGQYLDNPQIKKMLALQQAGKLNQAKKQGLRLIQFYANHPIILTCLGMIAVEQGDYDDGVTQLEKSLTLLPEQTTALSYLSIAYIKLHQFNSALRCADQAITLNPHYAEAHANRGNALKLLERYKEAIDSYKKAIDLRPADAVTKLNLGETFKALKQYEEAAIYLQEGLLLNPKDTIAQLACGDALFELGRYSEALSCYNAAIAINNNSIEALIGRGVTLIELREFESAHADLTKVFRLNPNQENVHLNLGVALRCLGRYEEAFAMNEIAIARKSDYVQAYNNQALLLVDMQRFDEAAKLYDKAIEISPQHYETYWNKALLHLLLGQYSQGWELYESRWKSIFKKASRHFSKPLWLGDASLAGKSILIYGEQGLGDDIQFCRYVAEVEKLGAKVFLDVHKPLLSLMSSLNGNFKIIQSESDLPDFDYHCPMMSLPYAFKTQLETIPATTPYLYANAEKAKSWQQKLGNKTRLRIGLVWSGSSDHKNDHNRSLPLAMLKPLFSLPFEFHALQKEMRATDMQTLATLDGLHTHHVALNDFSDTAALISHLDLVITVDTSVAHLAGAMGKECWVLLPHSPDFRWMLHRTDSPWYPSITLFRQPAFNDWVNVIDSVREQLKEKTNQV